MLDIFIRRNSGKTYVYKQGLSSFFALDRPAIAWTILLDQAIADWIERNRQRTFMACLS